MDWPPIEDEEAWKELVAWRHPQVNLNRLQIALLEKKYEDWSVLWNEHFLREELYRDKNGTLINHPLHLYEILRVYPTYDTDEGRLPPVHHIRDELFCEVGIIDLTLSSLQDQSDMDTSPSTTGPGQSRIPDPTPEDARHHSSASQQERRGGGGGEEEENVREEDMQEEEENMKDEGGIENDQLHSSATQEEPLDLSKKTRTLYHIVDIHKDVDIPDRPKRMQLLSCPRKVRSIYCDRHLIQIIEKLCGPRAESSTAALLRSMIRNVADWMPHLVHIYYLLYATSGDYFKEVFLLQCQMSFVCDGGPVNDYYARSFCEMGDDLEVMMEGARFLPRNCVLAVLEEFELEPEDWEPNDQTVLVLKDRLINWTLQDLCMTKIMQIMGGDAQKVCELELPVHIKELFRIPFQKRYEELEKRHEEHRAEEK